jgi:hypothetical protein
MVNPHRYEPEPNGAKRIAVSCAMLLVAVRAVIAQTVVNVTRVAASLAFAGALDRRACRSATVTGEDFGSVEKGLMVAKSVIHRWIAQPIFHDSTLA